jgi:hypothetical protein
LPGLVRCRWRHFWGHCQPCSWSMSSAGNSGKSTVIGHCF